MQFQFEQNPCTKMAKCCPTTQLPGFQPRMVRWNEQNPTVKKTAFQKLAGCVEKALQRGEPLKLLSFAQLESLIDMGLPALHLCRPSAVCFARRSPVLSRTL